jgi:peptide/nickel transport system permease protein
VVKRKKKKSAISEVWKQLKKNKVAVVSLFIIVIIILIAIFAPILAPYPYELQNTRKALSPSTSEYLLGTDRLGRDVLSRLIYGSRASLEMGLIAVAISAVVGIFIGSIAGYYGGWTDNILMRFLDIYQSIPMFLLCVTLAAVLGASLRNAILALGFAGVPGYARLMRASILSVREMEYVEAARSINAKSGRIIIKHIIPNAMAATLVTITMGIGGCVLAGAGLSFIGLGVQPPTAEWGAMISDARNFMRGHGELALYPGICVMITVLAFNLLGDGLRDALDPRLRS